MTYTTTTTIPISNITSLYLRDKVLRRRHLANLNLEKEKLFEVTKVTLVAYTVAAKNKAINPVSGQFFCL